jgi:hypothetical protein
VAGEAYRLTARHVLDIMFNKFQLMAHLAALRKYLLLGQVCSPPPKRSSTSMIGKRRLVNKSSDSEVREKVENTNMTDCISSLNSIKNQ